MLKEPTALVGELRVEETHVQDMPPAVLCKLVPAM